MVGIDSKGVEIFTKMAMTHPTVSVIHMIDCHLTSDTAPHFGVLCSYSKTLTTLVLDHNQLGSSGTSTLFAALKDIQIISLLSKISLRYNDIGSKAAEMIGSYLSTNPPLA
jgi:hypothetical protein